DRRRNPVLTAGSRNRTSDQTSVKPSPTLTKRGRVPDRNVAAVVRSGLPLTAPPPPVRVLSPSPRSPSPRGAPRGRGAIAKRGSARASPPIRGGAGLPRRCCRNSSPGSRRVDGTMSWNEITELVERARAGDRVAYGELAERFQPTVYAVALSRLR